MFTGALNVAVKPVGVGVRLVDFERTRNVLVAKVDSGRLAGLQHDEVRLVVRRGREREVIDDAANERDPRDRLRERERHEVGRVVVRGGGLAVHRAEHAAVGAVGRGGAGRRSRTRRHRRTRRS